MPRSLPRPRAVAGRRAVRLALVVGAILAAPGCSLDRWAPRTYEPPLQQGNVIEPEAVARLKPGMTRSQVRFVLGTPMVVDVFRNDRWDYVYLHRRQGEPVRQRRLAVFFEGDLLARVQTDGVSAPAETGLPGAGAPGSAVPAAGSAAAPATAAGAAATPTPSPSPSPTPTPGDPARASAEPSARPAPATASTPPPSAAATAPAALPVAPASPAATAAPTSPGAAPVTEPPPRGFFGRLLERIGL